ncbi:MAG: Branched-chain amino acid transport system permease protein LivM, partial [uncultured Rubrobacteraceae bacterium]
MATVAPPTASAPKRYSIQGGLPSWANKALAAAVIVLAILLPFMLDPISGLLSDCIIALAYVIMALGLNVVVGFAGLLDLGYVAFFAIGAYAIGWFASSFYQDASVHIGVSGPLSTLPGIHMNFLLVVLIAMVLCAIAGLLIGLPTLRLRGDYIAIVTLAFGE